MIDNLLLIGPTRRSIALQTRKGRDIVNEISPEPTPQRVALFWKLVKDHEGWEVRKPPVGGYNCAGHVWACRRTGIFDDFDTQVLGILSDDDYRALEGTESPKRGDLALYWESVSPRRELYHVGIVFEVREGVTRESPRIPWVLSKLDATAGEVLHHYRQVTFIPGGSYEVEFWTDRPQPSRRPNDDPAA